MSAGHGVVWQLFGQLARDVNIRPGDGGQDLSISDSRLLSNKLRYLRHLITALL